MPLLRITIVCTVHCHLIERVIDASEQACCKEDLAVHHSDSQNQAATAEAVYDRGCITNMGGECGPCASGMWGCLTLVLWLQWPHVTVKWTQQLPMKVP